MKNLSVIILAMILYSCFAQKQESHYQTTPENKSVVRDTIYLDTLGIDNETEKFTSKNWTIKSATDEVIFFQTVLNKTSDTLNLKAQAGAGWDVPKFDGSVIPNGCSKMSYQMITKNRTGIINTTVTIMYSQDNFPNNNFKQITVILCGRKE
jgi:hypothetical protein